MSIKAVVFDLDDTLYPEIDYVKSGFCEVAKEIEKRFDVKKAYNKLYEFFLLNKSDVYERVLRDYGIVFKERDIADLVKIYRTHIPKLSLTDEVKNTILSLRKQGLKIGIITDGRPFQQHAKIQSLGLDKMVNSIIVTDELGGIEYRKPNPTAFKKMCKTLCIQPKEMIYVGDNPKKDFAVKIYLPIKTVMLKTGFYQQEYFSNNIRPDIFINYLFDLNRINLNNI